MLIFIISCLLITILIRVCRREKFEMPPLLYSVKASGSRIDIGSVIEKHYRDNDKEWTSNDGKLSLSLHSENRKINCRLLFTDSSCGNEFSYEFFNLGNRILSVKDSMIRIIEESKANDRIENKCSIICKDAAGREIICHLKTVENRAVGVIDYTESTSFPVEIKTAIVC